MDDLRRRGQPLPDRADDHRVGGPGLLVGQGRLEAGDLLAQLAGMGLGLGCRRGVLGCGTSRRAGRPGLLGGGEGLGHLAVVAVDGHRLDPHPPGVDVQLLYVLDRHVLGEVDRLRDGPRDERLDRPHHADVAEVVDGVVPHRAGEHGQVLRRQVGSTDDGLVHVDVGDDLVHLVRRVAESGQGPGHRLVDDGHGAPADQLLGLDQPEIGLDAGGVAVHQQADGARWGPARWPASCARRTAHPAPRPTPRPPGPPTAARWAPPPRRCRPLRRGACAAR